MELGIAGRTAMVAAGSKGLGRAIAAALVREGARVSVCARSADALDDTARMLRAAGGEVLTSTVDVTRADDLERWHRETVDALGAPAMLVTNTGGPPVGLFEDIDEPQWQEGIDGTLLNVIRLCKLVLPAMRAAKYGRIVHLTSIVAKQPISLLTISSTLRAGLSGLTKTMATQVAADGITVNAVLPGHFATDRQVHLNEARARQRGTTREAVEAAVEAEIPARRFGRPEELADAVAFLLSERAGYINGTSIQIDGGLLSGTF